MTSYTKIKKMKIDREKREKERLERNYKIRKEERLITRVEKGRKHKARKIEEKKKEMKWLS